MIERESLKVSACNLIQNLIRGTDAFPKCIIHIALSSSSNVIKCKRYNKTYLAIRPTGNWRPAFADRETAFLEDFPLPRPDIVYVFVLQ